MTNIAIFENEEQPQVNRSHSDTYKVFQVFELPVISQISDVDGNLTILPETFLQLCLESVQNRNQRNLETRQQRSGDYFTSLNHAERYRIPLAMRRFNGGFSEEHYGLMSFIVMRGENVKNKVYNQRVSSINQELLTLERIAEIIYPTGYQLQHSINLQALGRVIEVPTEGFNVIRVDEKWLTN
jgi:hypothetical protein